MLWPTPSSFRKPQIRILRNGALGYFYIFSNIIAARNIEETRLQM